MDGSWNYTNLICPVCGGGKVKHYFNYNICEDCHYILPDSNTTQVVLYNIDNHGTGTIHSKIDINSLSPRTLTIENCELIKMHHKELDIEFEFNTKKLENIDIIEINGHKFVREKK